MYPMIHARGKNFTRSAPLDGNGTGEISEPPAPLFLHGPASSPIDAESLTFGLEEEFFLVDLRTRRAPGRVPKSFVNTCRRRLGDRVTFELKQSQVEIVSPILHSAEEASAVMSGLRAQVGEIANAMGLGIIGAGTHPLAHWHLQRHTEKPRYSRLADALRMIAFRDFICGLHIHVAVPVGDRIELMNRLLPWLPLFLALSTSSPFWNLHRTGLYGYRQAAAAEWPRAGVPNCFENEADYENFIATLVRAGSLEDGSEIWWSIRPSASYPTLELRIADSCTRVEDSVAIAMLFRCLVSAHLRLPQLGAQRSAMTRHLIEENIWRAQRYGLEAEFIIDGRDRPVSVPEWVSETLELIRPDARVLDPHGTLSTLRTILVRGTSAHEQIHIYEECVANGMSHREALGCVVDWLLRATVPPEGVVAELHGNGHAEAVHANGAAKNRSLG